MTTTTMRFTVQRVTEPGAYGGVYTVFDTKKGKPVTRRDTQETAAELAQLLNGFWDDICAGIGCKP